MIVLETNWRQQSIGEGDEQRFVGSLYSFFKSVDTR